MYQSDCMIKWKTETNASVKVLKFRTGSWFQSSSGLCRKVQAEGPG